MVADSVDDLETFTLGAILIDPVSLHEALDEGLRPEHFSTRPNAELFRAMIRCDLEGRGMDIPALLDALALDGRARDAHKRELQALMDVMVTSAWVRQHAARLQRWSQARRALRLLEAARARVPRSSADVEAWIERLSSAVLDLAVGPGVRSSSPLGESVAALVDRRLSPEDHPPERVIPLPWSGLARRAGGGLRPGQFVIVAARPKVGKSALVLQLALHAATVGPVLFCSLEMTRDEVSARATSSLGMIDGEVTSGQRPPGILRLADGTEVDERQALIDATRKAARLPLEVNDAARQTLTSIRAQARRMRSRGPLALIVVDYLQLVTPEDTTRQETREREVATIARGLKVLAKDCECPVIGVSQLNRLADGERPRLSHLRESGSLEQDANAIWFLHRDGDFDPDAITERADLILAAQRGAASGGSVPLDYRKAWSSFFEVDFDHPATYAREDM